MSSIMYLNSITVNLKYKILLKKELLYICAEENSISLAYTHEHSKLPINLCIADSFEHRYIPLTRMYERLHSQFHI